MNGGISGTEAGEGTGGCPPLCALSLGVGGQSPIPGQAASTYTPSEYKLCRHPQTAPDPLRQTRGPPSLGWGLDPDALFVPERNKIV